MKTNIIAAVAMLLTATAQTQVSAQVRPMDIPQVFGDTSKGAFAKERRSAVLESILSAADSPETMRAALSKGALPSISVVPTASSEADLTKLGLGKGIYLPIDLRTRASVYELKKGESVVTGVFVTDKGIFAKRISFLSGDKIESGSQMRIELVGSDGEPRISGDGKLNILDPKRGYGRIEVSNKDLLGKSIWIGWSFIDIDK